MGSFDSEARSGEAAEETFPRVAEPGFYGDFGLFWNFGLESPTRIAAFALYDDVHLVRREVEGFLEQVKGFVEWLAEGGNWGREVREVALMEGDL